MNSVAHADLLTPASPTAPRRSRFVTLFSWCLIIGAALLVPVSTVTLMMLLVGSDGTANATWSGALLVVGGPPATVLAGVAYAQALTGSANKSASAGSAAVAPAIAGSAPRGAATCDVGVTSGEAA